MDTFRLLNVTQEEKQRKLEKISLEKQMRIMSKRDFKMIQSKKEVIESYLYEQRKIYEEENKGGFSKIYPLNDYYFMKTGSDKPKSNFTQYIQN